MKTIVCDDGSTSVKLAWLVNNVITSSVTSNSATTAKSVSFGKQRKVTTEGRTFTFSEGLDNRLPTNSIEYQTSAHSRAAVWYAISSQSINMNEDLHAVVTLPIAEFYGSNGLNEKLIEEKKASMLKPVTINGDIYQFKKVSVYPEGIPATYEFLYNSDGTAKVKSAHKTIIIDVGGQTTDIAVITGAAEFVDKAKSLTEISGSVVANQIAGLLFADWGTVPPNYVDALMRGESIQDGEVTPQSVGLDVIADSMAMDLITHLQVIAGNFKTVSSVVLVGGAAPLVERILKANFKNVFVPEHGQTRLSESILEIEIANGADNAKD